MSVEATFGFVWEGKARSILCMWPYFYRKAAQYLSQKEVVDDKSIKAVRYFAGFSCPTAYLGPTHIKMKIIYPEVNEFNQIYTDISVLDYFYRDILWLMSMYHIFISFKYQVIKRTLKPKQISH